MVIRMSIGFYVLVFFAIGSLAAVLFFRAELFNRAPTATGLGSVVRGDFSVKVTLAGTVVPVKRTLVSAPYTGFVKKIFVKVGDRVRVGSPLVEFSQSLMSADENPPLRSPLQGVVVQVEKTEGEYLKEGDPKEFILRIDDLSRIFVLGQVPEMDLVKLALGQETEVRVTAILNKTYQGVLRELSLSSRQKDAYSGSQSVEFPVRIEILNPDEKIKTGMTALVDVTTLKKQDVLYIRHEFLRFSGNDRFVILKNGTRRAVIIGDQNDEVVEITSGLSEGDLLQQIDFAGSEEIRK